MIKNTPIKRSQNLVVLSQEHHHALVFCSRLKKAHEMDLKTLQFFVKDFWTTNTSTHFDNEEKWFLPEIENNEIKTQFIAEHQQIRMLIKQIEEATTDVMGIVLKLSVVLINHIRFEERTMFPYLEKIIPSDRMGAIGIALSKIKINSQKFTPEFWKNED
ncbi:MAG: hypothetical protein COX70_03670 [Flavobacteriales bacterium CG_4_10_14_0_2_um_filter_32_8]|nr:MAG: hypothetical protein COX70_03670 [Flavobacteriales bacterium CG_4_10_14_0_2_um_filter_32_8]PJB16517.1 MAG: hypothetical protein CO118_00310 [Flavobacteriales bacterium CG_4_9_14_3_um_filter_32_8]